VETTNFALKTETYRTALYLLHSFFYASGWPRQLRIEELHRQELLDTLGLDLLQLQHLAGVLGNDTINRMSGIKKASLAEKYPGLSTVEAAAQEVLLLHDQLGEIILQQQQEEQQEEPEQHKDHKQGIELIPYQEQQGAEEQGHEQGTETCLCQEQQEEKEQGQDGQGEQNEAQQQQQQQEDNPLRQYAERCIKAVQQYSFEGMAPPVQVANGDRQLLQSKGIMMRGIAVEDMSKTPCHVLLLPLREAVYARMGLERVMEYMCLPEGGAWGREWGSDGREVVVNSEAGPATNSSEAPQGQQQQQQKVQLPDLLPRDPYQLAKLVCRILRGLDPAGVEGFSNHYEQLLLFQVQQKGGAGECDEGGGGEGEGAAAA
jgi:hypothetical protein